MLLGRYRIESLLHSGGMGEILLAKSVGAGAFERRVVIKRLKKELVEDPAIRMLFEREAFLLARLHHPNIVRALDYFLEGGAPHLVLEHIPGRNLRKVSHAARKAVGGLPIRYALHVVSRLCRALHYTHYARDEEGRPLAIAHRDICPSNVMASFFGEVKLTDFGIANMAGAERLTGPGYFRGKVQYAAPEQITGEGGGVASDIYSSGVVLAEMLSGRMLFRGRSPSDTVRMVLSEDRERTIDRVLHGITPVPGLRAALRGSIAVLPRDRFPTALQFAETLEAIAREQDMVTTQEQLGLFLRRIYEADEELAVDDGFDWKAGAIPTFSSDPAPETATEDLTQQVERSAKRRRLFGWLPFVSPVTLLR